MAYADIEKMKLAQKSYFEKNREKIKIYRLDWQRKNKAKIAIYKARYISKNKEKVIASRKTTYLKFREKLISNLEIRVDFYDRQKKYQKKKRQNPLFKIRHRQYRNAWRKARLKSNPLFKLENVMRWRLKDALCRGGWTKRHSVNEFIGADFLTVKQWIESKFLPGMSWNNHGEWHLDHKIPLASAKNEKELYALFHYKNTQPLWAIDNMKKGAKCPI